MKKRVSSRLSLNPRIVLTTIPKLLDSRFRVGAMNSVTGQQTAGSFSLSLFLSPCLPSLPWQIRKYITHTHTHTYLHICQANTLQDAYVAETWLQVPSTLYINIEIQQIKYSKKHCKKKVNARLRIFKNFKLN